MAAVSPGREGARVDRSALESVCEQALQAVGYELVELELVREQQGWVLRVFIDHPQLERAERGVPPRRIRHADCQRASDQLGTELDVEDPIGWPYSLEVSSPGVFRPLRKERDFRRFVGFRARVKLREPIEGRRQLTGELQGAEDGVVELLEGERRWALPLETIQKAQLAEEY